MLLIGFPAIGNSIVDNAAFANICRNIVIDSQGLSAVAAALFLSRLVSSGITDPKPEEGTKQGV
jgi:hypothetical protein